MNHFVCMNWGTKYGADYVNRLYSMVARHTTEPFRFLCFTDCRDGIRSEVECFECPEVDIPGRKRNAGWRKLSLWASEIPGLTGTALFLDLDIVITGPLDEFFTWHPNADFCVIHNWTHPDRRIGNTSVFRFAVGSHPEILDRLLKDHAEILATYSNSQTFVSACLEQTMEFWPDEWCVSFKRHCVPRGIARWFRQPTFPGGARVVAFSGRPNPHEAAQGIWPAPWYKRFYKHIPPVTWIQEHWR